MRRLADGCPRLHHPRPLAQFALVNEYDGSASPSVFFSTGLVWRFHRAIESFREGESGGFALQWHLHESISKGVFAVATLKSRGSRRKPHAGNWWSALGSDTTGHHWIPWRCCRSFRLTVGINGRYEAPPVYFAGNPTYCCHPLPSTGLRKRLYPRFADRTGQYVHA